MKLLGTILNNIGSNKNEVFVNVTNDWITVFNGLW